MTEFGIKNKHIIQILEPDHPFEKSYFLIYIVKLPKIGQNIFFGSVHGQVSTFCAYVYPKLRISDFSLHILQ